MAAAIDTTAESVMPGLAGLELLHRQIDAVVLAGDWEQLEPLLAERDTVLAGIFGKERVAALESARALTDRILDEASKARLDVADKLAELRRGRKATDAYRAHR